jgi:glutathione S-transferase
LEHETREVNLLAWEQHRSDFKELNPHGKVPVLVDDGFVLRESGAILSYLGRRYGGASLWPRDARAEALAHQWLFFDGTHLSAPLATLFFSERVSPATGLPASSPAVVADNEAELTRSLDVLEDQLSERPCLLGDFSLVDCAVGVDVSLLLRTRLDRPQQWPHVFAYGERMRARAGFAISGGYELLHFDEVMRPEALQ